MSNKVLSGDDKFALWSKFRRGISLRWNSLYNSTTVISEQDNLKNTGFVHSHFNEAGKNATLLVLGNGRGGTSLISGVLHYLGVFMGDDITSPSYEDQRLTNSIVRFDKQTAREIINEYSTKHDKWGYKHPQAINFIIKYYKWFNCPRLIIVVKDVASIAIRHNLILGHDPLRVMVRLLYLYKKMFRFANRSKLPALIISYEKAVADPRALIDEIIRFSGINPSEQQIAAALEFIEPNSEAYKEFSLKKYKRIKNT